MSTEEILEAYPYLEAEDIKQCQEYASLLAREQTIMKSFNKFGV